MDLLLSFSTAGTVDIRNELTRVIRLEAGRVVGPVAALAEKIAIDLHLRCECRRKGQEETIGPFALRGRERVATRVG